MLLIIKRNNLYVKTVYSRLLQLSLGVTVWIVYFCNFMHFRQVIIFFTLCTFSSRKRCHVTDDNFFMLIIFWFILLFWSINQVFYVPKIMFLILTNLAIYCHWGRGTVRTQDTPFRGQRDTIQATHWQDITIFLNIIYFLQPLFSISASAS